MSETDKNVLPGQFTVRLAPEEREYVNENLDLIRGEEHEMTRSRIFITAVTKAIQNTKALTPREIPVDNPELLKRIEEFEQKVAKLTEEKEALATKNNELTTALENKTELPKHAIVLNLEPKHHQYFWGVLQVAKKQNYAQTYEEVLMNFFKLFHARREFVLTQEDINYLNTLDYDGPTEN